VFQTSNAIAASEPEGSRHAKSRSPHLSVLKACDLYRGLDRGGVVCLAIAAIEKGRPKRGGPVVVVDVVYRLSRLACRWRLRFRNRRRRFMLSHLQAAEVSGRRAVQAECASPCRPTSCNEPNFSPLRFLPSLSPDQIDGAGPCYCGSAGDLVVRFLSKAGRHSPTMCHTGCSSGNSSGITRYQ
jgi:hypothetical protein